MIWLFVFIIVVVVVLTVALTMRKNRADMQVTSYKVDIRKSTLGIVIEMVFILAVVVGCVGIIIAIFGIILSGDWLPLAWTAGGTFASLVMAYFVRITNNIYSLLMEQKRTAKLDEHTDKE